MQCEKKREKKGIKQKIFMLMPKNMMLRVHVLSEARLMPRRPEIKKTVLDKVTISRIERVVPHHEGFHFFKGLGDSTDKVAISLTDFHEKMRNVDIRSVNFHFKRQDFEKWIRDVVGDAELSRRIGRIKKESHGENLRSKIIQTVKERLEELHGIQTKK